MLCCLYYPIPQRGSQIDTLSRAGRGLRPSRDVIPAKRDGVRRFALHSVSLCHLRFACRLFRCAFARATLGVTRQPTIGHVRPATTAGGPVRPERPDSEKNFISQGCLAEPAPRVPPARPSFDWRSSRRPVMIFP